MGTLTHLGIVTALTVAACVAVMARIAMQQRDRLTWWQITTMHGQWAAITTGLAILIAWAVYGWSWPFCIPAWFFIAAVINKLGERRVAHNPRKHGQQETVRRRLPLHIETNVKAFKTGSGWDRRINEHKNSYDSTGMAVGPFWVFVPPGNSAKRNAQPVADEFADLLGGEWSATPSHDSSRITLERVPEFEGNAEHSLINQSPASVAEAIGHYPDLVIPRGVDCRGNVVAWKPESAQPHVLVCGKSGSGKTSALATMLTEGIAGGMAVIVCDYNYSDSFGNFADLPGVIRYANTKPEIDQVIASVKDIATARSRTDYIAPDGTPPKGIPILLIVDEIATMRREAKQAWVELINVLEKGRKARVHCALASQQITRKVIDAELRRHCPGIEQYGYLDRDEAALLWVDGGVGMTVPMIAGQGLIGRVGDSAPDRITGFYTPGTRIDRPLTGEDKRIYDTLIAQIYDRVPRLYGRLPLAGDSGDRVSLGLSSATGAAIGVSPDVSPPFPLAEGVSEPKAGGSIPPTGVSPGVASRARGGSPAPGVSPPPPDLDALASKVLASGRTKQPHPTVVAVLRAYLSGGSVSSAATTAGVNRSAVRLIIDEANWTPVTASSGATRPGGQEAAGSAG